MLAWTRALGPAAAGRARSSAGSAHAGGGSVFRKELRSWWRDPVRLQSVIVAPVFAVLTCLVPLAFDSTEFLPFIGALIALMGAVMSANAYGQDGTALWLTILTPGSERPDVRGRQLAWLAVVRPDGRWSAPRSARPRTGWRPPWRCWAAAPGWCRWSR